MSPLTKLIAIAGLTFGSALVVLAANATPDAPTPPVAREPLAKYLSIRFNEKAKPEIYLSDATLKPVLQTGFNGDLKRFTVRSVSKGALLAVEIAPWTGEYLAAWQWYLNSQWSVAKDAVITTDYHGSKDKNGNTGITSRDYISFTYDNNSKTLSWEQDGMKGEIKPSADIGGYYLVLKLAVSTDQGTVTDDDTKAIIAQTK